MKIFIKSFVVVAIVFLVVDYLWLAKIAPAFYRKEIGHLLGNVNYLAAAIFYTIYVVGIVYFVILPSLESGNLNKALISGVIYGIVCYGTYDLTNMATLQGWTWKVVIVDILWGGFVTGLAATISFYIIKVLR